MQESVESVCIVGLGYIGLPTASLLASSGYRVHGYDVDERKVELTNQGKVHISEPGLDEYVQTAVKKGTLRASTEPVPSDVFVISVPTPFHPSSEPDKFPRPNIDLVLAATKRIAPFVRPGNMVILESTSPVGTTELVAQVLSESGVDLQKIYIAYCPERVLPGRIMVELVENDRIVGGTTPEATARVIEFLKSFVKGQVFGTDSRTAEMAKLVENSYRDVNLAFANELSMLCQAANINVRELILLANRHPRVKILQPGAGVGGHCIAVDPWFIVDMNPNLASLIWTARRVNDRKPDWVIEQVIAAADRFEVDNRRRPVIACLGLAFKPNVEDLRESPALKIVLDLVARGYEILAVEPNVARHPTLSITPLSQALESADILVALVSHREFNDPKVNKGRLLDFCGLQPNV